MRRMTMRLAAAWLTVSLAACGGGGGSGGAGPNSSSSGSTASGLLPAAPAIGAILYANALVLRPVQAGATWSYRGRSVAYANAAPVAYLTTTSQTATSATGATETTTNSADSGPGSQAISVTGGVVSSPQSVDFAGKGNAQVVDFIELRSPVRQGDQYTILDQHLTDTAIDADRDGKPDALDVAIYVRVSGTETVTPPNLPAMQAVRVDTFVLSRVTYSSNGQYSPTVQASIQTWYVDGIGIVRRATTLPKPSVNSFATTDEQIASLDGVTTGLGAMAPVEAVIPTGNGVFPGQKLPGGVSELFAFPFGDHALVFTDTPGLPSSTLASRVDLRGNVTRSTLLPGLRMGGWGVACRSSEGVVYVEPVGSDAISNYTLTRIDVNGALVGGVRGVTLSLGGSHVAAYVTNLTAAVDGTTLWVLWGRWYHDPGNGAVPGNELVLRPYSLDGTALAAEMVVDPGFASNPQIAAAGGQVLMTWGRGTALFDAMFGSASLGGIGSVQALVAGSTSSSMFMTPLRLGANGALMWPTPPGFNTSVGAAGGVLLDSRLAPVRAGATLLDEQIAGLPAFNSALWLATIGSRIVVMTTQSATLWPGDQFNQMVNSVSWLDTGSTPLATTLVNNVRIASDFVKGQAVFADRVLVFGGSIGLATTVVWLNKGGPP